MSLSSPTRAFPVAMMRFSPFAVRGSSVVPVCLEMVCYFSFKPRSEAHIACNRSLEETVFEDVPSI